MLVIFKQLPLKCNISQNKTFIMTQINLFFFFKCIFCSQTFWDSHPTLREENVLISWALQDQLTAPAEQSDGHGASCHPPEQLTVWALPPPRPAHCYRQQQCVGASSRDKNYWALWSSGGAWPAELQEAQSFFSVEHDPLPPCAIPSHCSGSSKPIQVVAKGTVTTGWLQCLLCPMSL